MIGDVEVIPDLVESIRAVRCWEIRGGALYSLNGIYWRPGQPLEARCRRVDDLSYWGFDTFEFADHEAPGHHGAHGYYEGEPQPTCGIYAFKDISYGLRQFTRPQLVWGEVDLWGKHYAHEHGYRAQFARPVKLYEREGHATNVTIAKTYRIPLAPFPLTKDEVKALMPPRASLTSRVVSGIVNAAAAAHTNGVSWYG